jgi:hypothetical protein
MRAASGHLSRRFGAAVGWIVCFRDRLLRAGIKGCALFREDSAFDLEVVAKRVADEVEGVVVPRLEVDGVDVVSPGAVDDAADARPEAGHGAHAAGLEGAVEGDAFERDGSQVGAEAANDNDFRVCGGNRAASRFH